MYNAWVREAQMRRASCPEGLTVQGDGQDKGDRSMTGYDKGAGQTGEGRG